MGLLQAGFAWPVHLRRTTGTVCQSGRLSRHLKILCRRGGHSLGLQREGGYLRRLDSLLQTAFPQPIRREAIGLGDTASSPPEMLNWSGRLRADRFGRSSTSGVQAACEARTTLICLCERTNHDSLRSYQPRQPNKEGCRARYPDEPCESCMFDSQLRLVASSHSDIPSILHLKI